MVKRSRVLSEEVEAKAELPYAQTRLARRAAKARPRIAVVLLLGAAGFALEAALARDALMGAGALALVATAWGAWRGRLGGVIAAALAATLAILVPAAMLFLVERAIAERVVMGFVIVWGALMVPDVVTLIRDAELQYAYGLWARRDGET